MRENTGESAGNFMERYDVYFGSFASRGGTFTPFYEFSEKDGSLTYKGRLEGLFNPSYTNFDKEFRFFFSVSKDQETGKGFVHVWKFEDGAMVFLDKYHTGGNDPCYVMADRTNSFVAAANYTSGSFRIWKLNEDGKLTPYGQTKRHQGRSIDPKRQTHPYCHSTVWSPWHDIVYVCDLGTDRIVWYKKDEDKQAFIKEGQAKVKPGSGPRHLAFAPDRQVCYLLNEMGCTMTVYKVLNNGALIEMQYINTLPEDFDGFNTCADVHVSPDGKFVYASNRGHDSLAIFSLDQYGQASLVGHAPSMGKTPRGFALSPSGNWLICANQDSNNIIVFMRDEKTGLLEPKHEYQSDTGLVNVRFKLK
ncbi:MAG: lactonase family protein [Christensenellales bacterium]|jgi:6-phosphogluconolactonase